MTVKALLIDSVLLVLAVGCSQTAPAQSAGQSGATVGPYNPPPLIAWIDCIDACDRQLKAIRDLGDNVVPDLRVILLNGPSKERLDRQRQHLVETYRALKDYESRNPERRMPLNEGQYVELYMQKYVLLNRTRSGLALIAIATPNAKNALKEAQQQPNLPPELRRVVETPVK